MDGGGSEGRGREVVGRGPRAGRRVHLGTLKPTVSKKELRAFFVRGLETELRRESRTYRSVCEDLCDGSATRKM